MLSWPPCKNVTLAASGATLTHVLFLPGKVGCEGRFVDRVEQMALEWCSSIVFTLDWDQLPFGSICVSGKIGTKRSAKCNENVLARRFGTLVCLRVPSVASS